MDEGTHDLDIDDHGTRASLHRELRSPGAINGRARDGETNPAQRCTGNENGPISCSGSLSSYW
jgi:hypothetical protein